MATKKVLAEPGKNINVRLSFIDNLLGTCPASKSIYIEYLESKAPDAESIEEELKKIPVEEYYADSLTIFLRDNGKKNGKAVLSNHMFKGFLKNACKAYREVKGTVSSELSSYKSKIDNLIFTTPRFFEIHGYDIDDVTIYERPLRASTAQGERVALAASEMIPAGCSIEFTIRCLNSTMVDLVYELLDYGELNGIGQYHNGGYGRFYWEELDDNGNVIGGNNPESKIA